eukprot:3018271-Pyramimonas_sp.AAC.1
MERSKGLLSRMAKADQAKNHADDFGGFYGDDSWWDDDDWHEDDWDEYEVNWGDEDWSSNDWNSSSWDSHGACLLKV